MKTIQIKYHVLIIHLQNDSEDLENRVFVLELEMDTVQAEVVNLLDDVVELRSQDSLTDLRLITVEEDIEGIVF